MLGRDDGTFDGSEEGTLLGKMVGLARGFCDSTNVVLIIAHYVGKWAVMVFVTKVCPVCIISFLCCNEPCLWVISTRIIVWDELVDDKCLFKDIGNKNISMSPSTPMGTCINTIYIKCPF